MKRKLLSLLLISCCFIGAAACRDKNSESASLSEGPASSVDVSTESAESPEKEENVTVELTTEDRVAIRVLKTEGEETLLSVMQALQADGALTFTESGGMITSINGKDNPADWSYCWMVYTSDGEMSSTEMQLEYNESMLGLAVVGANILPVSEGEVYVWYYQGF